jgi:hypothetical protein
MEGHMSAERKVERREWTKADVRTLKALAGQGIKTRAIARTLNRTLGATYQEAAKLGVRLGARFRVTLGGGRRKKSPG